MAEETLRYWTEERMRDAKPVPRPRPRSDFLVGCVITTCAGREENLRRTLDHLERLDPGPLATVVVLDGCEEPKDLIVRPVRFARAAKHAPGMEQPRNVGARVLERLYGTPLVWFLDSDMVFEPDLLARYREAHEAADLDRVLVGPYEFMGPGLDEPDHRLMTDIRWDSFREHPPSDVLVHDLGAGLGCFSGNIVWPMRELRRVGGFHPELHHGRCEDGELGLRAASFGVPMSMAGQARAWHVHHYRDAAACHERNARDVPLLNSWHPWVESDYWVGGENMKGRLVTTDAGARFLMTCPSCGERVDAAEYWDHYGRHRA